MIDLLVTIFAVYNDGKIYCKF